jgi:uncharacterized membrane protein
MVVDSKQEIYKRIKIAGMVTFIPLIMGAGPLAGYFFGDFLRETFRLNFYVPLLGAALGFIASGVEVARILRIIKGIDSK